MLFISSLTVTLHFLKILTTMPVVDKIGSVVPVNVFESLQKTEEKLPDVVLPTNGLKDDQNDIFLETTDLFESVKPLISDLPFLEEVFCDL